MVASPFAPPMIPRGVKPYLLPRLFGGAALLSLLAPSLARAYDVPDFQAELFSADGVFLAPDERTSLLEALAAIASNFPGNPRIDDDLREKALALALNLDPLHYASRLAHRELALGAPPKPTPFFDSLASVSETLWNLGKRLAEPPLDPEERRLAAFLLELSLLTHPEPPQERLADFARVAGTEPPAWESAVRLQPAENASTARARDLFANAAELDRERRRQLAAAKAPAPAGGASGPAPAASSATAPSPPPAPASPSVETASASLVTVRQVVAIEGGPVPGRVTLTIRGPRGPIEREYLAGPGAAIPYPLVPSPEAIPLDGIVVPAAAAAGKTWNWPAGAIGEVRFDPGTAPPGPRRLLRASALLPTLVLLDSLLGNKALNDSFVLLGEVDPQTLQPGLPGDLFATLAAAGSAGRPYVLAPIAILEPLVAQLLKTQRLEPLFQYEMVGYSDLAAAAARLTAPTDPALAAASAEFEKIEAAAKGYSLSELARLPSGQERLRGILARFPDHLSARAMLEFGSRPVTAEILRTQFVAKLDAVVAPFLALDDGGDGSPVAAPLVEEASSQFLRLRSEAPPEARNLLGAGEDLVDAAELYLQLANKGTSIGQQRLRETRAAIAAYRAERSKLVEP